MVVLRLHFQVTGHKNPILSAASHGDLLATAERGNIRLWAFEASHAESGGPALLRTIACPRQPIRALFITPDSSHVVVVLPEDVVMFNVQEDFCRPKVLLHLSETKEKNILAAAWCRDISSLALATLAGVKIYKLLPFRSDIATSDETKTAARPTWPCMLPFKLLHNVAVKGPLSTTRRGGSRRVCHTRVDSLATDNSTADTKAGAALLVGIAGGEKLCVWDIVTGSLLAASVVTAGRYKVEKIAWHGPTAMSALLYSLDGRLKRVDVHQIDFMRQTTALLFSFVSDVFIAGFNFSAAPNIDVAMSFSAKNIASAHHLINQVYIHIVESRRTLRTWLLHPGGANAVAAYALPAAALQVPIIHEVDDPNDNVNNNGIGPEHHGGDIRQLHGIIHPGARDVDVEGARRTRDGLMKRGEVESPVTAQDNSKEEMLDPKTTTTTRAFAAYVFPSRLQGKAGPGILLVAGLTVSGISFLPEEGTVPTWHIESPIWGTSEVEGKLSDGRREGPSVRRVLGMRGLFSRIGDQQALAVMWAKHPCFQVLDVSRIGFSTEVQEIPMYRRHREDQLIATPRSDRPCYMTSWAHSTTLETLLCGWNDGVVDVVSPRTSGRRTRLFPPGSTSTPATALALIPLALILSQTSTQVLSDPTFLFHDVAGIEQGRGGVVVLVGGVDGTLTLWAICRALRPWHIVFAHDAAVVAVRSAMDTPQDVRPSRKQQTASPASNRVLGGNKDRLREGGRPFTENPIFFVLTAGANREVKVWGIDDAGRQGVPPLSLRGYTVVGGTGEDDRLTALELLSEGSMACGFLSGTVEVWLIPFAARDGILATAREAVQAFPSAHTGEVTSIAVSVGLRYRLQDGGGTGTGRVVLTTSADRTVVRWASTAPGDTMEPMARFCLSREPSSALLLPPPAESSLSSSMPQIRQELRSSLEATSTPTELFRVVAALDGLIAVLELASARSLIGGQGIGQNLRGAVTNAFPGTPLVPRLYLHPPGSSSETEIAPNGLRWAVGGLTGREAGWYDELGRIRALPPEWEALGARRLAVAEASRGAWEYCAHQPSNQQTRKERNGCLGSFSTHDEVRLEPQVVGRKKLDADTDGGVKGLAARRRATMNPHVKTLSVYPDEEGAKKFGSDTAGGRGRAGVGFGDSSLLKFIGGKVVKMDPGFVATAEWQRESPLNSISYTSPLDDTTDGAIVQRANDTRTIDLTVPTSGPSDHGQSAASERSSSLARKINQRSPNSSSFGSIPVTAALSVEHGVEEDLPKVGSIIAGETSISRRPPSHANGSNRFSGFSQSQKRLGMAASGASLDSMMGSAPPSKAMECGNDAPPPEGTWLDTWGVESSDTSSINIGTTAAHVEEKACETETENRKKKQKVATVVNAAREAREAGNVWERLRVPVFARHPLPQEPRQQFNFDSAQTPYSGMLGVGVAVPLGYSDKRLRAAKQSFTPLVDHEKNITRRRIGAAEKRHRNRPIRKGEKTESGNEDVREGSEEEERETPKIEPFPTGLVVSKHFRETRSGREILMLEAASTQISSKENGKLRSSDRSNRAATAWDLVDARIDAIKASAGATAELAALSPRSRSLNEVFHSLSAGRTVLSRDALKKWDYVSRSIERGLILEHQVKYLFRQAHGGRNRGNMVWRDMVPFYEGMEAALGKACAPPLVEEFVVDFEGWDSISVSLHLTKRGKVYLVATEAADESSPAPLPSPLTIRNGGNRGQDTKIGDSTRSVAAWVTASVPNPYIPLRLTLTGLLPESNYELFAYAENEGGRRGGARWSSGEDAAVLFSLDPVPSGMSADLVKATRVIAETAPEPAEDLDVPWEHLSEEEKMAEALAALGDPAVKCAVREMALDAPTVEDLKRIETSAISRNKWRSFCRWWTSGEGREERRAFLLRECVFAAQQPEVIEEAARMGVQLLEGDWNAAIELNTTSSTNATTASAPQRRWAAFRSWYRGGRAFDKALEALIKPVVMEYQPHSPEPKEHLFTSNAELKDLLELPVLKAGNRSSSAMLNLADPDLKHGTVRKGESLNSEVLPSIAEWQGPAARDDTDTTKSSGIVGWEEKEEEGAENFGLNKERSLGTIVEDLPTSSCERQTAAAKRLRMEARRRFLEARTLLSREAASKVGHLLDVMRTDMKSKWAIARASGVVTSCLKPKAKSRRRRRKQIERELALKRAEEILNKSEKTVDILKKQGSLGTVRPEDVASIGVFDSFNVEEFEPEQPDPYLLCQGSTSVGQTESIDIAAEEAAVWAPRSPDELTLELQLACVHPWVCSLAASAEISVPDPEDAATMLFHRKDRWEKFSAWYYPPPDGEAVSSTPQRQTFLDGEVSAAAADETVRIGMREEEILVDGDNFDVSDFVDWYCEDDAVPRQNFRRRRVEELLQARRLIATEVLGYIPSPFLFRAIPPLLPLPPPPSVERFQLDASRSPEAFFLADVSEWYDQKDLDEDDKSMKAEERATQHASLLAVSRAEESDSQALERRVAKWEDFRSHLMREAEEELRSDPFDVGTGDWQYHYALPSWSGLRFLGFEEGSGLDNNDEVLDALEVARKEAREEEERMAEVRRQREIAKRKRLAGERQRREEEERLRWMRETEEKRRFVQQHMANLKRQRALGAEREQMAREEALSLALMREEKRLYKDRLAKEAALAEERRRQELVAEAEAAELAAAQRRQNAEISAKKRENERSRQLETEKWAAETASREREAYLRELYTPFSPLWGWMWNTLSSEEGQCGEGSEDGGDGGSRPTAWWQGADAPQIWGGPHTPCLSTSKRRPYPRYTPSAQTDNDFLDMQTVSVGSLSREFFTMLGLPHESVRKMYEEGKRTTRDTDAAVESIQLGRIFTMFEDDQVRKNLIPVVPLERLEMRPSGRSSKAQLTFGRHHRQTIVSGAIFPRRSNRRRLSSRGVPFLTPLDGIRPHENWGGICTAGSHRLLSESGDGCPALPEEGRGRDILGYGDEYIARLTLSGNILHDKIADETTLSENESQGRVHGRSTGSTSVSFATLDPKNKPLWGTTLMATTKRKIGLAPAVSVGSKAPGQTQNDPHALAQSPPSFGSGSIGVSSRRGLLPQSHKQRLGFGPSYGPKPFGGKLGIAGEKKNIIDFTAERRDS